MTEPDTATLLGEVTIGARYNGPETSANGGYACGRLAAFLPEPAEVTLRLPPPLERPLEVHRVELEGEPGVEAVELRDGDQVIAAGRQTAPLQLEPPLRPSFEEALAAAELHPGRGRRTPLSDCFVCSAYREPPDGLGVCAGPLAGGDDVGAAPFSPGVDVSADGGDGLVALEIVWAVLDCPSYVPSMWEAESIALLGRLAVQRERDIEIGEQLAAVGWPLLSEGRKRITASALIDAEGEVVAGARATWIQLKS